ncbi:RHS repeat-associated core domain-containing protein [Massilia rhizosphaerae]|uniref:RHS repeat-associated core domain-containing protein n=1 Tax=Massilia rhizosphaerae TaxID=2784389 RepID=UPI0018DBFF44|nr:RHS repeat-associated core domain-containing protein [Massilia rhizosphaerae]
MSGLVGTLPGALRVDHNGGASFNVAIDVPPGIAGAAPQLGFGYTSLAANGPLGVGWALSGMSVIERCPSTLAQDGYLGGITFSDGDRLMLDQSRLVVRSGAGYFGADTVYETEIQTWHKVVPVYAGTPNRHGPDGFVVYQRDGRVFRYGATPDSQGVVGDDNPSIRAWYLSSITDRSGNVISFSYVDAGAGGTRLPGRIDYTANPGAGVAARRSVRFGYEARTDVESAFVAGYPVSTTLRLHDVVTMIDDATVSTYTLAYEYGSATGRSRLVALTRADASGQALPPTTFTWQDGAANFGTAVAFDVGQIQWGGTLLPMDIDGDGRVDFVNAYAGPENDLRMTIFPARADGTFGTPVAVAPPGLPYGGQFVTLDANGDGLTELVYAIGNDGALGLTLFTPKQANGTWTLEPGPLHGAGHASIEPGATVIAADVDGDGMADLVFSWPTSEGLLGLTTLFSNGTSFTPAATAQPALTVSYGGTLFACDVNADGMDDLVYATPTADGNDLALTVFRSQGRDGFAEGCAALAPGVRYGGQLIPLDVNADGNTDIVYLRADPDTGNMLCQVLVNDGCRFNAGASGSTGLPYGGLAVPASLTGSAAPELLLLTPRGDGLALTAFRTSADGIVPLPGLTQPPAGSRVGGNAMPLDLRGIGLSDLVYAVDVDGVQDAFVMPALGPYPDLLLSATNGVGACYGAAYAPLTDPAVYTPAPSQGDAMEPRDLLHAAIGGASYGCGAVPRPASVGARHVLQRTPIPKYVVRTCSTADGIGGSWQSAYRYEGALIDRGGRGWLGFAAVETDDSDAGTTTRTTLNQMFPLSQTVSASLLTRTSDGALMRATTATYQTPEAGAAWLVLATGGTAAGYSFASPDGTPVPDTSLTTVTAYDDFGNAVRTDTSGNALAAASTVVQQYTVDEPSWQLGLLVARSETTDGPAPATLRQDRYAYDPATALMTAHDRYDDVTGQWLTTAFGYDGLGNRTSMVDPCGRVSTTTWDAEFMTFVAADTVADGDGHVLVQTYTHEPAFGQCTGTTDPNGAWRKRVIDGLGRVVAESRTAPDGTLVETSSNTWSMENGMLCQSGSQRLDWLADAWRVHRVFTDGLGRVVRTERDPAAGDAPVIVESTYNAAGARLSQSLPRFDAAPAALAQWAYDAFGREVSVSGPGADGTPVTTTTVYPRVDTVTATVAAGTAGARTTTVQYALCGGKRVPIAKTDGAGATCGYAFDALGRLLALTDPSGIVTEASYDSLGRQVATSTSQSGRVFSARTIAYDDKDRTASETTAAGKALTLLRDGFGRIVRKSTGSGQDTTFVYDETDMPYSKGRLTTVQLPSGDVLRYGYDPDGNVTQRHVTIDGVTWTVTHAFLPDGRRASTVFPDGSSRTNTYVQSGVLAAIAFGAPGATARQVIGYGGFDAYDHPAQVAFGNGVTLDLGYDAYGRYATQRATGRGGAILFAHDVTRAADDAVVALGASGSSTQFSYDAVGRLQTAAGPSIGAQTFAYDKSGNCVGADGTAIDFLGYAPVSGNGAAPFEASYDLDGELTQLVREGTTTDYAYDDERRLVSVTRQDGTAGADYVYDHLDRRLAKTEQGITTYYVSAEYEVVRFADGSVQHSCMVGARGGRDYIVTTVEHGVATPCAGIPAAGEAFFIHDQIGSTRVVLDGGGAVAAALEYDAFGGLAQASGTTGFRYRFSGREYDTVAGAYYFGARYYDPALRRFLTPDDQLGGGLLDRDTFNSYAYVANDPLDLVDRDGHSWWDFAGQIVLDVAMVAVGIAVVGLSGGAAEMAGSTLIGAGVGGLAYDIKQAAHGNGAHVGWNDWGIQVGIGAATGLVTSGVAVGAGSALAGAQATTRLLAMTAIMAVTGAGTSMAAAVANDALTGSSLTSGLALAGLTGFAAGYLGGMGSAAAKSIFGEAAAEAGAGMERGAAQEAPAEAISGESAAPAPEGDPAPAQPVAAAARQPSRLSWATLRDLIGRPAWGPIRNTSPRFVFGSLRSVLIAALL